MGFPGTAWLSGNLWSPCASAYTSSRQAHCCFKHQQQYFGWEIVKEPGKTCLHYPNPGALAWCIQSLGTTASRSSSAPTHVPKDWSHCRKPMVLAGGLHTCSVCSPGELLQTQGDATALTHDARGDVQHTTGDWATLFLPRGGVSAHLLPQWWMGQRGAQCHAGAGCQDATCRATWSSFGLASAAYRINAGWFPGTRAVGFDAASPVLRCCSEGQATKRKESKPCRSLHTQQKKKKWWGFLIPKGWQLLR